MPVRIFGGAGGPSPVVVTQKLKQQIASAREAIDRAQAKSRAVIAALPDGEPRQAAEVRRKQEAGTVAAVWPALVDDGWLDDARARVERANELLRETMALRGALIEEPVRDRLRCLHGCESRYAQSHAVSHRAPWGMTVHAIVHTFDLLDHPSASHAFATTLSRDARAPVWSVALARHPITTPVHALALAVHEQMQTMERKRR